ncbi:hypothetical protein [Arvimicrobium flavum]|uniref:hypothetical protein n=1 Tax=Arvimicrobium flavum TaxID=3393320 RepID=UPI00237B0E70|nr:hypothetical protein [Mesorhizobium shangrilense]
MAEHTDRTVYPTSALAAQAAFNHVAKEGRDTFRMDEKEIAVLPTEGGYCVQLWQRKVGHSYL